MKLHFDAPNEKQQQFLTADNRFLAYGGARGGGKSWVVRMKAALMGLHYPGIRMLLLRRSYPELRENHILPLMEQLNGLCRYNDEQKCMTFPGGSRLRFGYCDSESDVLRYQGQEYDVIFIDEATQFTEYQFSCLTACLRGTNGFPKRMYLTCNPGGVGHQWVKRLFIDREYRGDERPEDYRFIQAKIFDNFVLMERDPDYLRMLDNLPEDLRRAWRDGDWDLFEGQYFTEFRRESHVTKPFELPESWRRYAAIDYGLDMLACLWVAVDTEGKAWVYREVYRPDLVVSDAARMIREAQAPGEKIYQHLAPPDLWNRRQESGRSVADIFAAEGVRLTKASNDRVMGWYDLREWMHPKKRADGRTEPDLKIFECCTNLIRTIPQLQHDTRDPNDCATEPHEVTHAPDALRYFCAGRPRPNVPQEKPRHWNFEAERPREDPAGNGGKVVIV